jgi:FixJ family two-component response regulator
VERQTAAANRTRIKDLLGTLSQRERQVLDELARGKSSKAIARQLSISSKTVDIHRGNIRQKLGDYPLATLIRELHVHFSDDLG